MADNNKEKQPDNGITPEKENTESPAYKTAAILLGVALVIVTAVFLSIRYFEQKAITAPVIETSSVAAETTTGNDEIININTATAAELQTLSGIGEGRAEAIVEYRNEYGNFASTEEIMNVKGIGESIYSQIKDNICC